MVDESEGSASPSKPEKRRQKKQSATEQTKAAATASESDTEPPLHPEWPYGVNLVVGPGGYWTGSGFSKRLEDAIKYPVCSDDYEQGKKEASAFCGCACSLYYRHTY